MILENDKDLAFTRLINKRYYSPDFLVIAYTPDKDLFDSETLKIISDITKKLLDLKQVHSVNSILNVPLLQSPPRPISELLEHIPTLEDSTIDKNLARLEFLNSPIYKDNLVSSDFKTTAILVNLKDDELGMSLRNKRDFLREGIKNKNISKNEMKDLDEIKKLYKQHRYKTRQINKKQFLMLDLSLVVIKLMNPSSLVGCL